MLGDLEDGPLPAELHVPPTEIRPVHGRAVDGARPRMRIGEALVAAGVLTATELESCLAEQEASGRPGLRRRLGDVVVSRGLASERDIARGLGLMLGFDYVDPAAEPVSLDAVRRVPRHVATRLRALPLAAGPTWLRVAVADPTDRTAVDTLRQVSGVPTITLVVATPSAIAAALDRYWSDLAAPSPREIALDTVTDLAGNTGEGTLPVSAQQGAKDVAAAHAPAEAPYRRATGWEYTMVGDGLPLDHPGYARGVDELEARLAELGADGWEAVGVHANGFLTRVLLKRRLD